MRLGPWFATIIATLTICSTFASASTKCARIFDSFQDVQLSNDPYADTEMLEKQLQQLTVNISLKYSSSALLNKKLDELLKLVDEESHYLDALQVRLLTEEPVAPREFEALAERVKALKRDFKHTNEESVTLLTEHPVGVPPSRSIKNEIFVTKDAEKDIERLQPRYLEKYREFIVELATVASPRQLNPRWAAETLFNVRGYLDNVGYSVRLNRGYRVVFSFEDSRATIVAISKTATHYN